MSDLRKSRIAELIADTEAITKALQRGVQEALLRHKQAGNPIAEWRDGKVVWIPPEEIVIPPAIESSETNGTRTTPESK